MRCLATHPMEAHGSSWGFSAGSPRRRARSPGMARMTSVPSCAESVVSAAGSGACDPRRSSIVCNRVPCALDGFAPCSGRKAITGMSSSPNNGSAEWPSGSASRRMITSPNRLRRSESNGIIRGSLAISGLPRVATTSGSSLRSCFAAAPAETLKAFSISGNWRMNGASVAIVPRSKMTTVSRRWRAQDSAICAAAAAVHSESMPARATARPVRVRCSRWFASPSLLATAFPSSRITAGYCSAIRSSSACGIARTADRVPARIVAVACSLRRNDISPKMSPGASVATWTASPCRSETSACSSPSSIT